MSDADNPAFASFGKLVPGFDFLQNLAKQAAGSATQNIPQLPNLGNWVAPTLNVEELNKRIEELKAVQFCHRNKAPKGLGVTLFIRSVSEDGAQATVGVLVDCWGDQACTGESCSQRVFKGSLTVEGDSATLLFRDIANPGRGLHDALHGHVENREGKPAIVFGKSVIQFTEGPAETRELIFQ